MFCAKIKNSLLMLLCLLVMGCDYAPSFNFLSALSELWEQDEQPNNPTDLKAQKTEIIGENQAVAQFEVDGSALANNLIPEANVTAEWPNEMAQFSGNIKGSSLVEVTASATIGEGNNWRENAIAPSAIIAGDMAIAMDGKGYISARNIKDLSAELWKSDAVSSEDYIVNGGLAINEGVVFAVNSNGEIAAINAITGKKLWQKNVNEPIRSSLKIYENKLLIVTADSQLLCLEKISGATLWQHRSIAQNSGIFGTSMPAISQNVIMVAFPSGDLSKLNLENGEMLWSDSLHETDSNGKISGLFSGVDANVLLEDNLLISANIADLSIGHDATTGARIWELPTGMVHNPWIAGDALFAITNQAEMLAIHKYRGVVAWKSKFAASENNRYYGAFLLNGQLIALAQTGEVFAFSPESGKKLWVRELGHQIAASPSFSGKNAVLVTHDAQLLIVK